MRDAILGLVGDGNKNIVLNMEDVSHIDSAGLGELVGVCSAAKRLGAKLRLLGLRSAQQRGESNSPRTWSSVHQ